MNAYYVNIWERQFKNTAIYGAGDSIQDSLA